MDFASLRQIICDAADKIADEAEYGDRIRSLAREFCGQRGWDPDTITMGYPRSGSGQQPMIGPNGILLPLDPIQPLWVSFWMDAKVAILQANKEIETAAAEELPAAKSQARAIIAAANLFKQEADQYAARVRAEADEVLAAARKAPEPDIKITMVTGSYPPLYPRNYERSIIEPMD